MLPRPQSGPVNIEDRNLTPLALPGGLARSPVRILLVDDNHDFRREAARFLAADPCCQIVAFAASGAEAIEKAEQFGPDLILLDISMPGMSGLEALSRIKVQPVPPKVIIVTLYGGPSYRTASESAMADGFLSKIDFVRDFRTLLFTLFPSPSGEPEGTRP